MIKHNFFRVNLSRSVPSRYLFSEEHVVFADGPSDALDQVAQKAGCRDWPEYSVNTHVDLDTVKVVPCNSRGL
jgi:hypothetical protein